MLKWLNSRLAPLTAARARLRLETLEAREVPAVLIQIDYSRDTSGFFNNADARAVMERAASELGDSLNANLAALAPAGGNTWSATFTDPSTGGTASVSNLSVGANAIRVFVGARALPGTEAGLGGYGGYSVSGSAAWIGAVQARGWSGFAPWGGSISFDTGINWHFGQTTTGLDSNELDFYSVATHELGHVLGIGTSPQWNALKSGGTFTGANARAVYGGAVPLQSGGSHWADGLTLGGRAVSLDPSLTYGTRVGWSALDAAALRDLGWGAGSGTTTTPAPVSPPAAPRYPVAFTGNTDGTVSLFIVANSVLQDTGARLVPFAGYGGAIRVAGGDFNGDGVTDYAFTTGAGPQAVVKLLDGRDGSTLVDQTVIFAGFRGGLFLAAADIDHDGKAELVVSADAGAGPHIQTFRVAGGGLQQQSSFFAFDNPAFRGGARVAAGDLDHDGFADVVVSTGGLALGRVAIYSGADLRNGTATRFTSDFIPFDGLWSGLNAAVGDMDGDGFAELAITPDRGPAHVKVWSGRTLADNRGALASNLSLVGSFFAFAPTDPSGARLALRDTDGDGRADLVAVSANRTNSIARVFNYGQMTAGGGNAPTALPLGTPRTFDGLYAGLTATSDPMSGQCHCGGCAALARLADGLSAHEPFSTVPVA